MKKKILLLIMTILILSGCEKKNNFDIIEGLNIETPEGLVHWDVLKVEGQTSGLVNAIISFDVYCPSSSGCDYISKFVSDKNGNTIFIKAFGNTLKDSPCTMAAVPIIAKYEFTSNIKGQFVLKFIKRDNSVIKHFLTIQ
jgi:hypothetical protein